MANKDVIEYLNAVSDRDVILPFVVEIVMRSGARYYVHSRAAVPGKNEPVLRVWDLRAMAPSALAELKQSITKLGTSSFGGKSEDLHGSLDWAILRAGIEDIEHVIEWHDRVWPEEVWP
jgi:hypothetical protein